MKGLRFWLVALLVAGIVMVGAGAVFAAETARDSKEHTVSVTIPESLRIKLDSTDVAFELPANYDFEPALLGPKSITVKVHVNKNVQWQAKVRANSAFFLSGGVESNKAASDLMWSLSSTDNFASMSTTDATVLSGTGNTGGWYAEEVYYKLNITGTELAGEYSLTVIYTLVTL